MGTEEPPHFCEPDEDTFYPRGGTEGKHNILRMFYIYPDGSIRERIYLNVDDKRQREQIIFTHFLQFFAQHIVGDTIGINVLSRDDPWDFRLELSTAALFNIEITSIADNALQHRVNSHQALFDRLKFQERVQLRDLQRRAAEFPDSELPAIVESEIKKGRQLDDEITNPLFNPVSEPQRIYLSRSEPLDDTLSNIIIKAIMHKASKTHHDKTNTVLIIDNRTSVERISTFITALEDLEGKLPDLFMQIWLYTGYCSNWDGTNGEYTMIHVAGDPYLVASSKGAPSPR